jgi:hypothetical protein
MQSEDLGNTKHIRRSWYTTGTRQKKFPQKHVARTKGEIELTVPNSGYGPEEQYAEHDE